MRQQLRPALSMFVILSVVTGGLYPLAVTALGQAIFPSQASGSLIMVDGKAIGSELIGQNFEQANYFWGRPSAAGHNAAASTGSNLGPTNVALLDAVKERADKLRSYSQEPIPIDLVTASGSGLDPHITPAAAYFQVPRIAKVRGISEDLVNSIVEESIEERTLGILGERCVNVLRLNRLLDARSKTP